MKILLFDTPKRKKLFPLTLTRATAYVRTGIFTVKERWERLTGLQSAVLTENYLQGLYGEVLSGEYLLVDASVLPTEELLLMANDVHSGYCFADDEGLVLGKISLQQIPDYGDNFLKLFSNVSNCNPQIRIQSPANLFQWNSRMIEADFKQVNKTGNPKKEIPGVNITNLSNVFIDDSATVEFSSINAVNGPVYIGKNAHVMEGCLIRGPFVLGEGAVLKMGTKVYGATTIGPYCVAGGEIKNSIMMGYSNKAHDGYLGDSIVGEWCNFGAGTSNSNIKNNAGEVNVWDYDTQTFVRSGIKCGIVVGDYTRTSINTSFNTGTVVGVGCNVYGTGLTPKFIPDFSWGADGKCSYNIDKALRDIGNWMNLKNVELDIQRKKVVKHIFELFKD